MKPKASLAKGGAKKRLRPKAADDDAAAATATPKAKRPRTSSGDATDGEATVRRRVPRKSSGDAAEAAAPVGDAAGVVPVSDIKEISAGIRKVLEDRGIKTLFEIQHKAFTPAFKGRDVVGKAKTGCGKTLAFVLPTVERICSEGLAASGNKKKLPICVAVAPTRELARQIFTEFQTIGKAAGLWAACFYGGTAFGPQCGELREGVDLLVCTPGRLLDHIRRETLNLTQCKVLILDEADEMLSMGFQDDVDAIMKAMPAQGVQKLLFSATLPKWVNALVSKHLKEPEWVDVTSKEDGNATNSKIVHKCVSCPPMMRGECIGDLCKVHAGYFGKTIVFTNTKKDCDELATNHKLVAIGAAALHGDIGQNQREVVMEGFRSGRIKCLVATDVAARGLDVPNVDLVIQTRPPEDLDYYVHRAGRTARGGRDGTCVTFYTKSEEYIIRLLEHKKGIRMQRVGPPSAADVVRAAAGDAVAQLDHVHQDSVEAFLEKARELIEERGAAEALAASMAALTGHTRKLKGRSLLSAYEGYTAMILESERGIENPGKGLYLLRQMLPEDLMAATKGLTACKDGKSCIFDVPDDDVIRMKQVELWRGCQLSVATSLPELQEKEWNLGEASAQLKEHQRARWQKIGEKKSGSKGSGRGKGEGGRAGGRGGKGSHGSGRGVASGRGRGRG